MSVSADYLFVHYDIHQISAKSPELNCAACACARRFPLLVYKRLQVACKHVHKNENKKTGKKNGLNDKNT
jgi:hypothetical protein